MEIILNKEVTPKKYIAQCPTCGSILEYDLSEVHGNEISTWHELHLECPVCKHYIAHSDKSPEKRECHIESSGIIYPDQPTLIPNGCKGYNLYLNGTEIYAVEVEGVAPTNVPLNIIGNCEEIEVIPFMQFELKAQYPPLTVFNSLSIKGGYILDPTSPRNYIEVPEDYEGYVITPDSVSSGRDRDVRQYTVRIMNQAEFAKFIIKDNSIYKVY